MFFQRIVSYQFSEVERKRKEEREREERVRKAMVVIVNFSIWMLVEREALSIFAVVPQKGKILGFLCVSGEASFHVTTHFQVKLLNRTFLRALTSFSQTVL